MVNNIDIAKQILTIIATLLPLIAILLQFMTRFYSEQYEGESKSSLESAVLLAYVSMLTLVIAGYIAGNYIRLSTSNGAISSAIGLIQTTLMLLFAAVFFIGRDIVDELDLDIWILSRSDKGQTQDAKQVGNDSEENHR